MIDAGPAGDSNEPVRMDVRICQNGRSGSSEETRSKRSCRRMEGAHGRRKDIVLSTGLIQVRQARPGQQAVILGLNASGIIDD